MSPQALRTRSATFGMVTLLLLVSMLGSWGSKISAADKPMPAKADVPYGRGGRTDVFRNGGIRCNGPGTRMRRRWI